MSRPFTRTTTHRSTVSTAITALAAGLILSVMFLMVNIEPACGADGDQISGTYGTEEVPYRLTEDSVLIIGQEDAEYSVNCPDLINSITGLDKENVTAVDFAGTIHQTGSCYKMLDGFSRLQTVDFSGFETSQADNMRAMFQNCSSLRRLDLSGFDTSSVTNMRYMFNKCTSLRSLYLTGFNTSQVTEMQRMFQSCSALTVLDLSGFDTGKVTNMSQMFYNCRSLRSLDVSGFDTGAVDLTDPDAGMNKMFQYCDSLQAIALGEKSIFAVDLPASSWTRAKLPDGAPAQTPSIRNLPDYTGSSPGWYITKDAAADVTPLKVVSGTTFTDFFGCQSSYFDTSLIHPDDPADTEYTWEKTAGKGELTGGDQVNGFCLSFRALSPGDVTLQLSARSGGQLLRTTERTYRIVKPSETYRLDYDNSAVSHPNIGDTFSISLLTWLDDGICSGTDTMPSPAKADFSLSVSGSGQIRQIESAGNAMTWEFEAVRSGFVSLTFSSNDGSWSDTIVTWIHDPNAKRKLNGEITWYSHLANDYDGTRGILFELYYSNGSAYIPKGKRGVPNYIGNDIAVLSSDESVAIPGTPYWDKPLDWDGETAEFTAPLKLVKPGRVTIWIVDKSSGEPIENGITMNISQKAVDKYQKYWLNSSSGRTVQYGGRTLTVYNLYDGCSLTEGDRVTLNLGGQKQTAVVTPGKVTKFSIPLMKTGTSGTITYRRSFDGYTVTRTAKIKDTRIRLLIGKVKRSSKKVTVTVTDDDYDGAISAVQGDIIKIKVGKKTYTKKVGSKPKYKYTQKIKKQKKGTKIKVTVYNKFKQIRCTKTIKVKK